MARLDALVIVIALAAPAMADPIALPDTRATLELDLHEWTAAKADPAHGLVAVYTSKIGSLAITRAPIPNPDAWRAKTRDTYVDELERGLAAALPAYKRTARTVGDSNGVPIVDIEARTKYGTAVFRFLLFRTYSLTLALEPKDLAHGRAIAHSFTIPPEQTPR
ncbi:MAG TPA: hypothetical protein VGM90_23755 [Kofleriaceae bacterium]